MGSQAEYGPHHGALDETAATRPTTVYGVTKLCACFYAERLCRDQGIRFAWLRLFSSYGPSDDSAWMIPSVVIQLLRGQRPALTAGLQRWDYIHVADVATALIAVAQTPTAEGVFNLGSGEAPLLREVVEAIRDRIDQSLPLGFGEVPYRTDQVMHLQADIRRLREATGWRPRVPLREGLAQTIEWYRENLRRYT
jgi:nucleoside-diphosphate-sugar epimerase